MHEQFKWVGPWSVYGEEVKEDEFERTAKDHRDMLLHIAARFDVHVAPKRVIDPTTKKPVGWRFNDEDDKIEDEKPNFNFMGQRQQYDDFGKVSNINELVEEFNRYDAAGKDRISEFLGALTSPMRYLCFRRIIEPGYFGLYRSSGRYMIVKPGIRFLASLDCQWIDGEPGAPRSHSRRHRCPPAGAYEWRSTGCGQAREP